MAGKLEGNVKIFIKSKAVIRNQAFNTKIRHWRTVFVDAATIKKNLKREFVWCMWETWVDEVNCYLGHYETKVLVLVENVLARVIIVLISEKKIEWNN